jgi:predicted PurR-regulated permease PerM
MNETDSYPDSGSNAFLPLVLISVAFISLLVWQLVNITSQKKNVVAAEEQLETSFKESTPQHEKLIEQSKAVQAKLEAIATDLLNLAKANDPDAKKIIEKYKIQQGAPAAAPTP